MTVRFILALVFALFVGGTHPVWAQSAATVPTDPAGRAAIEAIVREYLMKNPEVIQDAIAELERRTTETQKTAQAAALRDANDALTKSPHGTVVGNPSGDVTLVEFFDYNCPYCKRALSDVQALVKADPKLRVVLKDMPVLGPESLEASRFGLAAKMQLSGDKLFDYHARLIASRGRVNGERAMSVAREMGLDMARLSRDVNGDEVKAALAENADLGEKLGLTGTPAFVIGPEVISGAVGVEPLRTTIAAVRQCGRASC